MSGRAVTTPTCAVGDADGDEGRAGGFADGRTSDRSIVVMRPIAVRFERMRRGASS